MVVFGLVQGFCVSHLDKDHTPTTYMEDEASTGVR